MCSGRTDGIFQSEGNQSNQSIKLQERLPTRRDKTKQKKGKKQKLIFNST